EKYFSGEDPLGKVLNISRGRNEEEYIVSAVVDNKKEQSSIQFDFLGNAQKWISTMNQRMLQAYLGLNPMTFIRLNPDTDVDNFRQKLLKIDEHIDQGIMPGMTVEYRPENIKKIHLDTEVNSRQTVSSDPFYSYILSGLGGVVLLIACINYMTLSIGLSVRRNKEVGVRKVIGAVKQQLVRQYLGETVISSIFALAAGIVLAVLLLPLFNEIAGKNLAFTPDLKLTLMMLGLVVFIGIIAGSYPALVQSGFDPVRVFRGNAKTGRKNILSKGLVIIQFSISIFLIVLTTVFQKQLNYISEKDLGYDQERLVEINLNASPDNAVQIFERFKNEIKNNDRIVNVAATSQNYGNFSESVFWTRYQYFDAAGEERFVHFNQISYDFLETNGIELVKGRNFSKDFGSDPDNAILVNEAAVKYYGFDDPLNKRINKLGNDTQTIIGVVKDFHFASLHGEIKPLILGLTTNSFNLDRSNGVGVWGQMFHNYNYAIVKISEGNILPVLDYLKDSWKKVSPESPYSLQFVDETIQAYYESEQKWGRIINYASIFAVVIACLGLFGLTLIAVQERIKEIGIRKVMGATQSSIVTIISKDLLLLVAFANIIAWPSAYFVMSKWLESFAYRIGLDISIFLISGLIVLAIALITVCFQALKAANTNPVNSLRYE
ncbi:ABC transporter permease, partial [candidate division KSB1 bacterium]